ncbi:hypothetical protein [Planctomycetes bacterium Pla163]|uniref:hypothetical protein n=1 Tax=Rohdeia mirabilis TaxID=2528008 RepID=UPI0011A321F8
MHVAFALLCVLHVFVPDARAQRARLFGATVEITGRVESFALVPPRGGRAVVIDVEQLLGRGSGSMELEAAEPTARRLAVPLPLGEAADLSFAPPQVVDVRGGGAVRFVAYDPAPRLGGVPRVLLALPRPVGAADRHTVPWPALLLALCGGATVVLLARSTRGRVLPLGASVLFAAACVGAAGLVPAGPERIVTTDSVHPAGSDSASAPGSVGLEVTWTRGAREWPAPGTIPVLETSPTGLELDVGLAATGLRVAPARASDRTDAALLVLEAVLPDAAPATADRRWWRDERGSWWAAGGSDSGTAAAPWTANRAPVAAWAAAGWPAGRSALVVASADGARWWRVLDAPRPAGVPAER